MTTPELLTDTERLQLLYQLYDAFLKHLHMVMTSGDPLRASFLEVVRQFLSQNGITAANRAGLRRGLENVIELSALPFDATGNVSGNKS